MEPMTSEGSSVATVNTHASQDKIGDALLEHIATSNPEEAAQWGRTWVELPEEHACSNKIHEFNATYLTTIYLIPKGRVNAGDYLSHDGQELLGRHDLRLEEASSTRQSSGPR